MSLNDPQWGKKGNSGPPDLDELWRNLNQKLNSLFGRKGDSGPREPNNNLKQYGGGIGLIFGILFIIWIISGFYIVNEGKRGVVLRLGKYTETTLAGWHWHLPFPLEKVEVVDISNVRTVTIGYNIDVKNKVPKELLMLTNDLNIVEVQFAVQYTLDDPKDYLFNNRTPDETVKQVAETAIREIVGKNTVDSVLRLEQKVSTDTKDLMQEILSRYKTGVQISEVALRSAQPPEQVQMAFDDVNKAGQDRDRQKNDGEAYANDLIPRARGMAARLLEEANGYKQKVMATAEGDASRFKQVLVEYSKAPGVTRDRLYLDMMQQILGNTSKVVIDQKSGNNLLYLPLDKLMQLSNTGSSITTGESATLSKPLPNETISAPEINNRIRENLRSREREQR